MSRPTMPAPTACFRSPSASTISWTWSASSSAIASTKKCGCRRSWLAGPDPPSRRIPHHRIAAPIIAPVSTITVGGRLVGDDAPTYVIAEIGSNHDGSLDEAVRLIEAAAGAGADCIKFQAFRAETLVAPFHPGYATLERLALPSSWLPDLKAAAGRCGVHFTATPFDLEALRDLVEAGAATGLPLVVSTGAANLAEVDEAMRTMQSAGATQIALMHCASAYPATFEMANVRAVATLIAAFGVPVGF